MVYRFVALLFAIALVGPVAAQPALAQTDTTATPLSAAITAHLDDTLASALTNLHVPGGCVLILRDGKAEYVHAFGYTTLAHTTPVTPATHFEIGSITKQFTAAAILQLRDAGKLSLDDKLSRFVPEYSHASDVTIRQLLLQVSGIPNYTEVPHYVHIAVTQPGGLRSILKLINGKPLNFRPGTQWQYSNTNYEFLGRVIEKVSGEPYTTYLRTNVLDRAGMAATTTIAHEATVASMATGYADGGGHVVLAPILKDDWAGAAGDLVSTVGDLAKWDNAYFGGRIVSLADVAEATTPPALSTGAPSSYAYGWLRDTELGMVRIWHNGGTFGFSSYNGIFPQEHLAIIVLLNNADVEAESVGEIALTALYPKAAAALLAPSSGEDAAVTARAKAELAEVTSGHVDRTQLTPSMSRGLTAQLIASVAGQLQPLGKPTAFIFKKKRLLPSGTLYEYLVKYAQPGAQLFLTMTLDSAGRVAELFLSPSP